MNAPTRIRVTQEHIDRGVPEEADLCPIALALKEQWDEPVTRIEVVEEGATVHVAGGWYSADAWPEEAAAFVSSFDAHYGVGTFEFAVDWYFEPDPDEPEVTP